MGEKTKHMYEQQEHNKKYAASSFNDMNKYICMLCSQNRDIYELLTHLALA